MIGWQKPFRGTQLNKTHPLSKGLVGAWIMNEATGEIVHNAVQHNYGKFASTSSASNPIWNGSGVEFTNPKTRSGINLYTYSWLEVQSHTVFFVIRSLDTYSSDSEKRSLLTKENITSDGYEWVINSSGQIEYAFQGTATRGWFTLTNKIVPLNTPTTVCLMADHIGGTINGYIDGVWAGQDNMTAESITHNNTREAYIGARGFNAYDEFDGTIEAVYLFDRVLSAPEAIYLHREPYCMFTKLLDIGAMLYTAPVVGGSIINQFQKANLGADLFNGSLI